MTKDEPRNTRGTGAPADSLSGMGRDATFVTIPPVLTGRSIVWMRRIGYVARGVVFLIIGSFALFAAGGLGADPHGARDSLELLFRQPLGGYFLWTLAAGLACFAGWRLLQAVFDLNGFGNGLYGWLRRSVLLGSGVFYVALAAAAIRITFRHRHVTEDQSTREWAAWALAQPLGRAAIGLVAAGFIAFAIGLAAKAIRAPYRHHLDGAPQKSVWTDALGSFGTLTRALVFLLIGGFLAVAAYDANSREALSLAGVLQAMQYQAHGGVLLGIAALGLLAFGLFEMIEAAE